MTNVHSMTGFASVAAEQAWGSLSVELRTVNHRYLEVSWRGPDELRVLESSVREVIQARMTRGKVDCRLALAVRAGLDGGGPSSELIQQLAQWQQEIRAKLPDARKLSVAEILQWPGMFQRQSVQGDELATLCHSLLARGIDELNASRAREGERTRAFLLERCARIEAIRQDVRPRIPELVQQFQSRLSTRLREALGTDEYERVHQEVVLHAARIDVEEELDRLGAHVAELQRVLERGGAVGKRLDFLMQELHREANTLGSKSVASSTSAAALELKVLIEQMREQVQNLE